MKTGTSGSSKSGSNRGLMSVLVKRLSSKGDILWKYLFRRENYSQQFTEGKMIGGKMFYERDLEDYQNYMRGRRVFLSNLNWNT